jgi:uncharacterized protein (TIGR03437 family)
MAQYRSATIFPEGSRMTLPLLLTLWLQAQAPGVTYSYDAAGRLTSATYANGKVLSYSYDANGNLLRRLVAIPSAGTAPQASAAGVVNAASFLAGPIAPGEIVTIFGTGIGPAALANFALANGLFSSYIGDTSVLFDGVPAPLYYASAGQTAVFVPYSITGQTTTQMVIVHQGRPSAPVTLPVLPSAPGLFSLNQSGQGPGAILNQDNSLNSAANPAAKGSIVILYGTGEGQTDPPGVAGRVNATVFPRPTLPFTVTIGGLGAEVLYAGAAPGLVSGVFQVNVRIPDAAPSGDVPVRVQVGSNSSQPGLTVRIQ